MHEFECVFDAEYKDIGRRKCAVSRLTSSCSTVTATPGTRAQIDLAQVRIQAAQWCGTRTQQRA